ncbi:MAG: GH32 C-terminal domain-containing protein [Planctomycetes bacterium]|nr:GH32 C-terminal domain-containing protein [Planctomycetota bacterium]
MNKALFSALLITFGCLTTVSAQDDILIADFEGDDYGNWKVTGEAFGPGPARGTLPGQMDVAGFEGKRLVSSFYEGDDSKGTLTSHVFEVKRKYINFLIGGGMNPGQTCINLLVDGKVARTATGPNDRPGGSEELAWHSWDVSELVGRSAQIQIVDSQTGGWGHINIDHITQSSNKVEVIADKTQEFLLQKKYLNLPVKNGANKRYIHLIVDGKIVREFDIEMANGDPDFWVFLEIGEFKGKRAILHIDKYDPARTKGFDSVYQADTYIGEEDVYREKLRPQLHFTSKRGWNNDSNGMVYYDGEYHLFYQHNPFGWNWGNMTWGHAVSTDMIHWTELGDAIHPDHLGTIFSGSAVVDVGNTAGFQTGDEKVIVCIYTSAGGTNPMSKDQPFTQSIAYSNDRGRTWTVYDGNPILGHINGGNPDPKVIWHTPTHQWVMALYLDDRVMAFFTSKDLKSWEFQSKIKCFHECPELFALPVDGDKSNEKWILYGGSGEYLVGHFDGREFKSDTDAIRFHHGNCFYASQTFSNIPESDGRRIQIAWGRVKMPGMPFNQMMLFPVTLTLHSTEEGPRMFAEPVREVGNLHGRRRQWKYKTLEPGDNLLSGVSGELLHIRADLRLAGAAETGFVIRGIPVTYNAEKEQLSCQKNKAKLIPENGKISLEILVDRTSIEIFGSGGRMYMPMGVILADNAKSLEIFTKGGNTEVESLEVSRLRSAWR